MNYHIDEKALEQGEISITIDGEPLGDYSLLIKEIVNELNEIFHNKKPTTEELRKEIIRILMEFDQEWKTFTVESNETHNRIMTIHDYLLIKKFEELSGTEDLPF
jgi:hypothetical protein